MATGDLMRVIQLETNKLYQFETRMQSSIEERKKTLQSLKNHGEVVQNQFCQSRQLESSKDEVNEGENNELRKGKETFNGFRKTVNVMSVEIHQAKEVLDLEIKLIPELRHDSLHFQNIKVELLKKEKDEENSMKGQTQDAKQEVEVTENRLNNVTKVNDDEMAQYKEKIYNLSQELSKENGDLEAKQKILSSNFSVAASHMVNVESQKKKMEDMKNNETMAMNQLVKKEEESDAVESQLKLENEKTLEAQNKIHELTSEHENLVAEMQVASSKITELIMDWQLQSELQMLKMKVFESEKLEEKLSIQANQLSEMTEKMEELVLEKTTLEKEKAKVQDVLLNLDNLRGKKEDVAKECETLNAELAKKRSLIQDAKKKMDDAKEVSKQYRSLDGQFKSLSKDQEDLRFNLLNIEETHLQLAKNNESENIEIKELQSMLETLPDEEIDLDMDLDDAPEEIIGNLKVQMEQISKEMQEKQNFHDNLKREIERQHKAKKKSLMEKTMVAKTKPTPPTKMGGPLPPPSSVSAKRGSPIQPEVNSKKFRGEMMPSKSPMKKPTLPPPSAKSKPKSRAAAQKAKKLFAMDGYSIFDESP